MRHHTPSHYLAGAASPAANQQALSTSFACILWVVAHHPAAVSQLSLVGSCMQRIAPIPPESLDGMLYCCAFSVGGWRIGPICGV
jgi:hypothetical protein